MAVPAQLNSNATIEVRRAEPSDLDSLTTILARSFHPINAYVKEALPDTDAMRDWWRDVYREEVDSKACHPLVAVDTSSGAVIGVAPLRRIDPRKGDAHGGLWTAHPWTTDHSQDMWGPPIACMLEYEKRLMGNAGKAYYLLEVMAVDHAYARRGIGKNLVAQACEIADKDELPIFLQSGSAKDFYLKLDMGFKLEAEPVWEGRTAAIVVRSVRGEA